MFINKLLAATPPSIGNFSLNDSQQPGPFVSFGQNIIDKNQLQLLYNPSYSYIPTIIEGTPSLLYGLTDSASILLTLPYAFKYNNGTKSISGIGDLILDFEYAFYNYENATYSDEATVIFSPTFPVSNLKGISKKANPNLRISGFSKKNLPSSFNAFTYFFGTTYARTLVDWYAFIAPGFLGIENHDSINQGSQFYYNFGIGRNIKSIAKLYTIFGLLELNGQYSNRTKFASYTLPNTGGNLIDITPSLSFATQKFMLQVGISLPVFQKWYGNQQNTSYNAGAVITWTIN